MFAHSILAAGYTSVALIQGGVIDAATPGGGGDGGMWSPVVIVAGVYAIALQSADCVKVVAGSQWQ